jgi:hypothetical protein
LNTLAFILFLAQIGYPGGQIPGQYPPGQYPPGQYPPGQYPGTGVGIPLPGRTKKSSSDSSQTKNSKTPDHTVGVVQKLDDKSMEVVLEDTRIITFALTDQTSQPKDLQVGYTVDVTSKQDDKGNYTADTIKVTKKGSAQPASSGSSGAETASNDTGTTTLKGPKYDSGDDGPPQLKRGKPATKPRSDDADVADATPPAATAGNTTAGASPTLSLAHPEEARQVRQVISQDPREALIDRARDEAVNFIEGLPNYVCNENTTRYVSEGHVTDWHAIDVVTLELVYDGGKEDYRNIQINGKAVKGKVEDTGAWSTGEFGTILVDLMSPYTAAKFHYVKDASLAGFSTSLYDFTVEHQNSHWHVVFASQSILPSYKGSIWVDKKSARVIRIEMQATNIPKDFPEDAVETAVDYGFISLGTEKFFLPTQAEILSCERGSNACGRNVIEFRNYHRFTGDTKIIFDK